MAIHLLTFAPDPRCRLCTQPNLDGEMTCWAVSDNEWRVALSLMAHGVHVHTNVYIGYEADIVLPFLGIVAEYDSRYYHEQTALRDEEQRQIGNVAGYRVVRLREPGLPVAHQDDLALLGVAGLGGLVISQIAAHLLDLAGARAA
jgi:hypothetical protein